MLTLDWERIRLNFLRRYKWAFRPEYDRIESAPPASPDYPKFLPACAEMLKVNVFPEEAHHLGLNRLHLDTQSRTYSPSDSCRLANHILRTLLDSGRTQVGHWTEERLQVCYFIFVPPPSEKHTAKCRASVTATTCSRQRRPLCPALDSEERAAFRCFDSRVGSPLQSLVPKSQSEAYGNGGGVNREFEEPVWRLSSGQGVIERNHHFAAAP
jgi:hypothetical protein